MFANVTTSSPMLDLAMGERIKISGALLEVEETNRENVVLRYTVTKVPHIIANGDFVAEYENGKFTFVLSEKKEKDLAASNDNLNLSFEALPEHLQDAADYRLQYVKLVLQEYPNTKPDKKLKELVDKNFEEFRADYVKHYSFCEKKPSPKTLRRWCDRWEAGGRRSIALVPCDYNKGPQKKKLTTVLEIMIEECISEHYLRREKVTVDTVHAMLFDVIEAWNNAHKVKSEKITFPHKSTLKRRIRELDPYDVAVKKHGKEEADKRFKPVFSMLKLERPMQVVQLDHTKMDIMVLVPGMAKPMRPYLTILLDQYSRMVVGMHIGFDPYGYTAVMLAVQNMVLSKGWVNRKYPDIVNANPAFGPAELILTDNGGEHHSISMKRSCQELGMLLKFCESKTPYQKAHVERFFRTLNTKLLHQMPGTTFSNTHEKGDYESEENAFLKFDQLVELVHEFIYDEYHVGYHRGIRCSPLEKMEDALKVWGLPPMRMGMEEMKFVTAALSSKKPKVQPYGVDWEHLTFNSHELSELRKNTHGTLQVEVKYDPLDLSYIWVVDKATMTRMKVPAVDREYTKGLEKFHHDVFIKATKRGANGKYKHEDLMRSKANIWNKIREQSQKQEANSPRVARFTSQRMTPTPIQMEQTQNEIPASGQGFDDMAECALDGLSSGVEEQYESSNDNSDEVYGDSSERIDFEDEDEEDDIREIAALSSIGSS